jgi:TPR repeat protein
LDLAETPAKQYQLGIKYAEKRNMEKAKYWIKKAYESSDTIIREKAENAWNQYKLWQY